MKSKLLSLLAACVAASLAHAGSGGGAILPGSEWRDTAGQPILVQRGCLVPAAGKVFWFGVEYDGDRPCGLKVYSSTDLATWEPVGAFDLPGHPASVRGWHDAEGKAFHLLTRSGNKLAHHTAPQAAGPFVPAGELVLPEASGEGDFSVWIDDAGDRLLAYTSPAGVEKTNDIVLAVWPKGSSSVEVRHRFRSVPFESPCLWRQGDRFILTAASTSHPYASTIAFANAPALEGPWSPLAKITAGIQGGSLMTQKGSLVHGFDSKHNGIFRIPSENGPALLVYSGDRWSGLMGYGSGRHVLLPVEVVDGVPGISWLRPWFANLREGTFSHELKPHRLWR